MNILKRHIKIFLHQTTSQGISWDRHFALKSVSQRFWNQHTRHLIFEQPAPIWFTGIYGWCVFWPACGCFAWRLLVEINFFSTFASFSLKNKKKSEKCKEWGKNTVKKRSTSVKYWSVRLQKCWKSWFGLVNRVGSTRLLAKIHNIRGQLSKLFI